MATAEELAKKQREISVAEFFEKNRHLLGFDNKKKALLTAIKEAVDNSLDACEEARILPDLNIEIIQMSEERFRVIVEDNGPGIVKSQIPKIFGKLLYGSKFGAMKSSRGQQGIGISAALLYSQLTTGKPAKIISRTNKDKPAHYFEIHIDTRKNEPEVIKDEEKEWRKEHGTRIELEMEGIYQKGNQSVDEYLKQTSIVNPHATIVYANPKAEQIIFSRVTKDLPAEPKEIKPHPYGVELGMLIKMLNDTESRNLSSFLQNDFSRVSPGVAKEICEEAKLLTAEKPKDVSREQADKLIRAMQKVKIMAPPTDCLSPIGQKLLEKGLKKEIKAEFYTAISRPASVYRGNPFVVECCTGDTKLHLEDGSIVTIKDYVENGMSKNVLGMNDYFKIIPNKVKAVQKFENVRKILKIKTRSGRELKVTDNNELPILDSGELVWKEAKDVKCDEFIAAPRIIHTKSYIPDSIELFDEKHVVVIDNELVSEVYRKLLPLHGSAKAVAKIIGAKYDTFKAMNRNKNVTRPSLDLFKKMVLLANENVSSYVKRIKKIAYRDTNFTNPKPLLLPEISEDLMYLLGLINSDGYIGKYSLVFVNKDELLHKLFSEKFNAIFNEETKRYGSESIINSKVTCTFFRKLKGIISRLSNNLIAAWLKGIVDGDGWTSLKDDKLKEIGIATAKKESADFVQTMLLRLGILSKIEYQKVSDSFGFINGRKVKTLLPKYNIIIKDFENAKKFASQIGFRQQKRAGRLAVAMNNCIEYMSKSDTIPISRILKNLRQDNRLFQYELGFSDQTIRQVENHNHLMTRPHVQKIAESFLVGKAFEQLTKLALSDILWDRIISITIEPHEEYVYDLTTEHGNFVANNIIMHNCAIAYGRELEAETPVRIMRFANRVPLQFQQSGCGITEAITDTNWKAYGLQQSANSIPVGPCIIVVHISSVWTPYTSEAKEAIAHYPEIIKEIKLALQECGRDLMSYVGKKKRIGDELKKRGYIEKYIPVVAEAIRELLELQKVEETRIESNLKEMLEKHRGEIKEIADKNEEYDEAFAKIGKEEKSEGEKEDDN